MKIKLNAELTGEDVIKFFIDTLNQNNVKVDSAKNVKVLVVSKDGKDVEITPDRLKVVFNQE